MELLSNLVLMALLIGLVVLAAVLILREARRKDVDQKAVAQKAADRGGWPESDDINRPLDELDADARDAAEDVRRPL